MMTIIDAVRHGISDGGSRFSARGAKLPKIEIECRTSLALSFFSYRTENCFPDGR